MRNIFLCFLTVMLFAPDAICATGVSSRTTTKPEVKTDTTRTTTSPRQSVSRTLTTPTRSEKTVVRDKDTVSRSVTGRDVTKVNSRIATQTNVTSRTGDQGRSATTNVSKRSQTARIFEKFKERLRSNSSDRNIANRAATTNKTNKAVTAQEVANAKELLEQTASLNKSCQEQYNECMDQFCAVVDTNQKRCSCSANLSKYSNVQEAVTNANAELNEVAQRIRYVGLSADEIRAIMTETQAEAELDNTKDTSTTRNMLSKIESLIKDPTSRTTMISDNDFGLDLDFDFSDESADIFSLDFLNANTDSISSKRGTALYNAAKKRCKVIIDNCKEVGATSTQITGNYDLAIDKDCIEYEQGLKKMNETLASNVRSAGLMLQKARLAVLQNKNQYDAKGCIGALETCMTDEMVCGSDYVKCLDPTKRYIDENGKVVLGQDITNITDFMTSYNNAMIDEAKLSTAAGVTINNDACKHSPNDDGTCVIKYLLGKIGTGATVKDGGLCRAVLDKCQQYTYNNAGKYNPYNDIVVNYIQRAMVNIKSAQQQIISDYASSCMTDVASCYNQQVTQVNSWSSVASVSSIRGVMTGACRNVALTCAYAVFADMCRDTSAGNQNVMNWVLQVTNSQGTASASCTPCDATHQDVCIEGISEIFYQSLLCPENSLYDSTCINSNTENRRINGCVNRQCRCNNDYATWNGSCLTSCTSSEYRNSYGTCTSCDSNCGSYTRYQDAQDTSGTSGGDDPNATTCPTGASVANDCTAVDADGTLGGCITTECRCASDRETDIANNACVFPGGSTCPTNATEQSSCTAADSDGIVGGCVSAGCQCDTGYQVSNGSCTEICPSQNHRVYDPTCTGNNALTGCVDNSCRCATGFVVDGNACVAEHSTGGDSSCSAPVSPQDREISGCVETGRRCDTSYTVWNGTCQSSCSSTQYRDSNGDCQECPSGNVMGGTANTEASYCLTCPVNSSMATTYCGDTSNIPTVPQADGTDRGCLNRECACNANYFVSGGTSCETCPTGSTYNASCANGTGTNCINNKPCRCDPNTFVSNDGTSCESCPSNSTYTSTSCSGSDCLNPHCQCNIGYSPNGNACVTNCPSDSTNDSTCTNTSTGNGGCVSPGCRCNNGYTSNAGTCNSDPCSSVSNANTNTSCAYATITNRVIGGCVTASCSCNTGFSVWNGECRPACSTNQYREDISGWCQPCSYTLLNSSDPTTLEYSGCGATPGGGDEPIVGPEVP